MRSFIIFFFSFYVTLLSAQFLSAQTIPFSNLFMQTHEPHATHALTFFWGVSGNATFYLDQSKPDNSFVTVSVNEAKQQKLSEDSEAFLSKYTNISRVENFVTITFNATQIALSLFSPNKCGMFLDLEDTVDLDIPVDMKNKIVDLKVMFNFIFDFIYKEELMKKFSFLEKICIEKAHIM